MSLCGVQESSQSAVAAVRGELSELRTSSELQLETVQQSLSGQRAELLQQTAVNGELQKRLDEILSDKLGTHLRSPRPPNAWSSYWELGGQGTGYWVVTVLGTWWSRYWVLGGHGTGSWVVTVLGAGWSRYWVLGTA